MNLHECDTKGPLSSEEFAFNVIEWFHTNGCLRHLGQPDSKALSSKDWQIDTAVAFYEGWQPWTLH